jgi:hypothetical protein
MNKPARANGYVMALNRQSCQRTQPQVAHFVFLSLETTMDTYGKRNIALPLTSLNACRHHYTVVIAAYCLLHFQTHARSPFTGQPVHATA